MIAVVAASHVDHLPREVIDAALAQVGPALADLAKTEVVIAEITLPGAALPCGIYGPAAGDPPVEESEVRYATRPGRKWPSRLIDRPTRPSDRVTLVAGPYEGQAVLYTAYAGPAAPPEAADPKADDAAKAFWAEHALVG